MRPSFILYLFILAAILSCNPVANQDEVAEGSNLIAIVVADSVVSTRVPVYLDGSMSYTAVNTQLTFSWQIISKPEGSKSALTIPTQQLNTANNSFTPDVDGIYKIALYVFNETDTSNVDTILINSQNFPPTISLFKITSPHGAVAYEKDTQTFHFTVSDPNYDEVTYYLDPYGDGQEINEFKIDSG